ncbi:MAG: hypothetical protein E6K79_10760 [Candidatus Eisenbacteria bacterium]|uniref:DUF6249 domain-containing protein n=1 Tax=Eiseniibacteriota bacterium TaxID=2212470 RepID=A0A538THM1_UNCEI|nr:MAG: hypothetical protein E6K79_10760 [Candidatus Eisenbacteria bacterium]
MDNFFALFAMAVPIVAIVGGISVAIVRIVTQARLEELARRERIAAIERGADPSKLPPLPTTSVGGYASENYPQGNGRLRRAHGLLIGGLITVAAGIGLAILVGTMEPDKKAWVVGLLPILVGAALLISSRILWPQPK